MCGISGGLTSRLKLNLNVCYFVSTVKCLRHTVDDQECAESDTIRPFSKCIAENVFVLNQYDLKKGAYKQDLTEYSTTKP